jgi:glutamate synthase domain-containing protein 3
MSGGIAYVLDEDGQFGERCNLAMVALEPLLSESEQEGKLARALWHRGQSDEAIVRAMLASHAQFSGSTRAKAMLADWTAWRGRFVKVFPSEYRRALGEMAASRSRMAA